MNRLRMTLVLMLAAIAATLLTVKLMRPTNDVSTPNHPTLTRGNGVQGAEARIALVIGNSRYSSGALPNPGNDAKLVSDTLSELGFDVVLRRDADQTSMKRAIQDFGTRLGKAGAGAVGLFFYAGHGVQSNGHNYLIPTTAHIDHEGDLDMEAVSADWVLEQMRDAGNDVNIVILDACRNNPFKRSMRSVSRGLAVMEAPKGTVIAYSTAPGEVASDGDGRDSPYSSALAAAMRENRDPVEQMFKQVRVQVLSATEGQQTPWEASSLTGNFAFAGSVQPVQPMVAAAAVGNGSASGMRAGSSAPLIAGRKPVAAAAGLASPSAAVMPAAPPPQPVPQAVSLPQVAPVAQAAPAQTVASNAPRPTGGGAAAIGQAAMSIAAQLAPAFIARNLYTPPPTASYPVTQGSMGSRQAPVARPTVQPRPAPSALAKLPSFLRQRTQISQ